MQQPQRRKQPTKKVQVDLEDIAYIRTTLQTLEETVKRIDFTVVGDSKYGQIGLVEQVKRNSAYIEADKSFKSKLIGAGFILGGIWTFVLKFWK